MGDVAEHWPHTLNTVTDRVWRWVIARDGLGEKRGTERTVSAVHCANRALGADDRGGRGGDRNWQDADSRVGPEGRDSVSQGRQVQTSSRIGPGSVARSTESRRVKSCDQLKTPVEGKSTGVHSQAIT